MSQSVVRLKHADRLYIGGEWLPPSTDRRFEIVHPGTADIRLSVPEAREADMDRAVSSAREAFDHGAWPRMSLSERCACMLHWADMLDARAEDLAVAYTTEIGATIRSTRQNMAYMSSLIRHGVKLAEAFAFEEEMPVPGGKAVVTKEPVGVVAAIVPWNFPAHLGLIKMVPALIVGCTMVVKPSPEAPLDMILMAECADLAGFPKGVLSIVQADRDVGDRLIRDLRVDKVSFTGSTAAGRHIGAVCMDRVARVSLELGGKSPAIILDDAPMEAVVPRLVRMSTLISGQACMSLTRVLVSEAKAPALEEALAAAYAAIRIGDPFDETIDMGPLINARQRDRVEGYVATGTRQGARIATGGRRPTGLDAGFFFEPTVFAGVTNDMTIAQEEIFGPVISVIRYRDEGDAVALANDTPYGLNAAIFTEDADRFRDMAGRIRAGTVAQNALGPQINMPFGGFKQSGIGREGGVEAFELYTEVKVIYQAA
ncbi:aldehyde dehydrogenase [Sphingobium sp. TKS]|uniref:aldehyde dehydrogenase n=1 Tax=Sphingobium sp. TKS TaxID=1315974 RepID=UPI0007705E53|nr:aldehyde dehydrogenase [Sphingobium sp. TKS]AMK25579.1 aldehyde dehydrogenase [Sphingobium sp. TKS]